MKGDGNFGRWITDEFGLPAYEYQCDQFTDPNADTFTTYGSSIDHFHQLGNDRLTATAHNGGYIQVLEPSRGYKWITYQKSDKKCFKQGGGIGIYEFDESGRYISDLYTPQVKKLKLDYKRYFGIGYFKKIINLSGIEIMHSISTPLFDDPIMLTEISLKNGTKNLLSAKVIDFWDINLYHILKSLIVTANNRKKYGTSKLLNAVGNLLKVLQKIFHKDTDGARKRFNRKFNYIFDLLPEHNCLIITPVYGKSLPVKIFEPAKHDFYQKSIFLSMINTKMERAFVEQESIYPNHKLEVKWEQGYDGSTTIKGKKVSNPILAIGTNTKIEPNSNCVINFIFGASNKEDIPNLINKYKRILGTTSVMELNAKSWEKSLLKLETSEFPWLKRETQWHSYYTRSSCHFDEYYGEHKFPQGSIYLFGHGLDGSIRDYALFLTSIIFLNPTLAKEYLRFMLSLMTPEGKLPYSLFGFGKQFTGSVHSNPSDIHLFLLWAIVQYVYYTRDFHFLDEKVPFYPKSLEISSTVFNKIEISLNYLFSDNVGLGKHGLIKSNDGDWSDGISLMVENRRKFVKHGESMFNSTFALFLFPKLIPLLKNQNIDLEKEIELRYSRLKDAVLNSYNGKWYYRGWDGQGNPIGDRNIYLEHHTWLLISEILNKKQSRELINQIYENLDERSTIGQLISYPAQSTMFNALPEGWDVNGGIWHAMNALLTWGYAKTDPKKAINSLEKNSMMKRAEIYPNIWYGIWSGPDAYIADYAQRGGEAFYHLTTPMCDFPLMNLNIHACYLLSIIKILGIEVFFGGLSINPNILSQEYKFRSNLLDMEKDENQFSLKYKISAQKEFVINIIKPSFCINAIKIYFNDRELELSDEMLEMKNELVTLRIKCVSTPIDIKITK